MLLCLSLMFFFIDERLIKYLEAKFLVFIYFIQWRLKIMAIELASILTQDISEVKVKVNGRAIELNMTSSSNPKLERIRYAEQKNLFSDGQLSKASDLRQDFDTENKNEVKKCLAIVKGWKLSQADWHFIMPIEEKMLAGVAVNIELDGILDPIEVSLASANHHEIRELQHRWLTQALVKNKLTDHLPPLDKQVENKVKLLGRVIKDWNLVSGGKAVPINEQSINQIVRTTKDFQELLVNEATNDLNFCEASFMTMEELNEAEKDEIAFDTDKLAQLLYKSMPLRQAILRAVEQEDKFRRETVGEIAEK